VKTTAFDLQLDPSNPSMQLHKLDRAKDPNFWSVWVSKDFAMMLDWSRPYLIEGRVEENFGVATLNVERVKAVGK